MAGKVIAVANMKGGVGKTAVVIGLAEALAAGGDEVLVIDLDAQANASICLTGDKVLASLITEGKTIEAFLADYLIENRKLNFNDCIRECVSNVSHRGHQLTISLLASSPELRLFEQELIYRLTKRKNSLDDIVNRIWVLLKDQINKTRRSFKYILIDCPPGISTLTDVSIRLADLVIVPTIPDFLSTYGLQAFCRSIWKGEIADRSLLKKPKQPPHVLITRMRPVNEHRDTIEKMLNERSVSEPSFTLFETRIPETIIIPEALAMVDDCPAFNGKWKQVASVLEELAIETKEVLNGTRPRRI